MVCEVLSKIIVHYPKTLVSVYFQKLLCNTRLLPKLVQRDKLNCLILNLYPGNEGYSLMLKSKTGVETETVKLPYEVSDCLRCRSNLSDIGIREKRFFGFFYQVRQKPVCTAAEDGWRLEIPYLETREIKLSGQ